MRQLIGKRQSVVADVNITPRKIFPSPPISRTASVSDLSTSPTVTLSTTVDTMLRETEKDLGRTAASQEELQHLLVKVAGVLKEVGISKDSIFHTLTLTCSEIS
jgi:hypothetical protein